MQTGLLLAAILAAWVGHACFWTWALNNFYARPLPKSLLKIWRLATGVAILAFPILLWFAGFRLEPGSSWLDAIPPGGWGRVVLAYGLACLAMGGVVFPLVTLYRLLRKPPAIVVAETTTTLDLHAELGHKALGDGKWAHWMRLPFNCVLKVDFTELSLAVPDLPPAWDGLSILLVSDVHFHGNPSREFFERVLGEIESRWPTPDLVCLVGDYLDSDDHGSWIGPLLGRLSASEGKFAILGNHDIHHHPDRIGQELIAAGYRVIGNGWVELPIRGEPCAVIGHEGPWFRTAPDMSSVPASAFRLCLSHTPDNFYWGIRNGIQLMLCGHVHGGQIRLPVIGSIFVPSRYSRRFDMGVFASGGTAMVVGRGLSGKEPLRFRCHPQVVRIVLRSCITK